MTVSETDKDVVTLDELAFAVRAVTLEIVTVLSPIHEIENRLQDIGSQLLTTANGAPDGRARHILEALAHSLIATESS